MTVRSVRIASLLALAVFAATATTSSAALSSPSGLHGFLLRADEPGKTSFTRTPSFAWNPVSGARTYQFQLSLSSTFRDNGIVYNDPTLRTPVSAPTLTLPWISDALYARVRADLGTDSTPWSAPFRFDVTPPAPPSPLPSYPGVLRWTPTEGADGYQVWLIDIGKMEFVRTNVMDEREFYTFHQSLQWSGTVRWRVRAVRGDQFKQRVNGLPVAQTAAWSRIYSSSNAALTTGPIELIGTVSDVFSDGSSGSPPHEMMPAFLWTGNQTSYGATVELYRVEVFTDKQCLNRVYTGAVVGSPAWAPRLNGTLSLPQDAAGLTSARGSYLGDGKESSSYTFDGDKLAPAEQQAQATPTTSVPGDVPAFPGTSAPGAGTDPSSGGASGGSSSITVTGNLGPPVSLWDVDWPQNGYYWTVMPVAVVGAGTGTSLAAPGAPKGTTSIPVLDTTGFVVGDTISIGVAPSIDTGTITAVGSGVITIGTATTLVHAIGDPVILAGGSLQYVDAELAQDICANPATPPQRLGISSEPSLTSAQSPFATGLSSTGRLTSAAHTSKFYGSPLIAWTPAFNADIYEVQYSKKAYPFKPEVDPRSKVKGFLTFSTSDVLPLSAGTWYYRVRGIDYNLPTGVQQMSWSDPEKLVVAPPTFKIAPPAVPKRKFKIVP
jgi:hypothetical protein